MFQFCKYTFDLLFFCFVVFGVGCGGLEVGGTLEMVVRAVRACVLTVAYIRPYIVFQLIGDNCIIMYPSTVQYSYHLPLLGFDRMVKGGDPLVSTGPCVAFVHVHVAPLESTHARHLDAPSPRTPGHFPRVVCTGRA